MIANTSQYRADGDTARRKNDLSARHQIAAVEYPFCIKPCSLHRCSLLWTLGCQPPEHRAAFGFYGAGGHHALGDAARAHQNVDAAEAGGGQHRTGDVPLDTARYCRRWWSSSW